MKAIVCTRYGGPQNLTVQEVPTPKILNDEVLVKIYASNITKADAMMRAGTPKFGRLILGLTKPKKSIIGTGFSGEIVQIGNNVSKFKVGDNVFGETALDFGANAEYMAIKETGTILHKPNFLSFYEACTLCDGIITSANFLTQVLAVQPNTKLLINGASGSLGVAAVQIANTLGVEVHAVCSSKNTQLMLKLGAKKVIDYNSESIESLTDKYDYIYDTVGNLCYKKTKHLLTENGVFTSPVMSLKLFAAMALVKFTSKHQVKFSATGMLPPKELKKLLTKALTWIKAGKLTIEISERFTFNEIQRAHTIIDSNHKRGNFVLEVIPEQVAAKPKPTKLYEYELN